MDIFFDIDDTLVDSESAHSAALKKICDDYPLFSGESPETILSEWFAINERYITLYFEQKISLEQQRIARIKKLWGNRGVDLPDDHAREIFSQYHRSFLESCLAFPDVLPCLERLKDNKLGIITNGTSQDQLYKLKHNHLLSFFTTVIISEEKGVVKPGKEIFRMAAHQAGSAIADCLFIGNSFETDYQGSREAGMKAIWLDRKICNRHSDAEKIHALSELINHPLLRKKD